MTTQFPLHDTAFADEPYTQTFSGNTLGVVLERSPENTEKRKLVVLQAWGHKGPEEGSPSVGDYLKQQLGKYKLTVDEFSQKILDITHQDIDPSLINRWKRNDDIPNRTNTQLLAQAFDQLEMTRLLKNTALH
jgi:hypothetical protein